jgi:ABC-type transport system substrate-binding protein
VEYCGGQISVNRGRLLAGPTLVAATALLLAAPGSARGVLEGGTLRVGTQLLSWVDPALEGRRHILGATCAGLMRTRDKPLPAGVALVPEIAAGYPSITDGHRTYTFTLNVVRFSTGAPVTARSFVYTINRLLNPTMKSPAASDFAKIVGAQDVIDGKAPTASGLIARGNRLIIKLIKSDGGFLRAVSGGSAGFCVLPENAPIEPEGIKAPVPSAGPYYVAEYVPNERVVLKRNRYYRGNRPHHIARFVVDLTLDAGTILDRVERGELDASFATPNEFGDRANEFKRTYGVNRSRFFVAPGTALAAFALNMSGPLFTNNLKLRQAVNFAVDRKSLLRERGLLSGYLTDQYLMPGIPGFRDERIYPLNQPNLVRARALARGRTRSGKAVLYTLTTPPDVAQAQILKNNLRQIGLELEIKQFPGPVLFKRLATPGEPFDIGRITWVGAPDPSFLNLFDGRTIGQTGFVNFSYFNSAVYNRRLQAASELPAGSARNRLYAKLDLDIAQNVAPAVPYAYSTVMTLVSARVGCVVVNPVLDLAAVCLK